MTDATDYSRLPEHLQAGAQRWVRHGIPPGSFLKAVICNDLTAAVTRAGPDTLPHLKTVVQWFYNDAPMGCWGTPQRMEDWQGKGGLLGREAA